MEKADVERHQKQLEEIKEKGYYTNPDGTKVTSKEDIKSHKKMKTSDKPQSKSKSANKKRTSALNKSIKSNVSKGKKSANKG